MLQQTTSKAVIPYYEKFLKQFPDISALARANKKELFSVWAGLGYYKRAENLLQAAKELNKKKKFPGAYKELLNLPGFGSYTARAVSSIAFEEATGVLDGNVIRFLSRFHGLALKHWQSSDKATLQSLSDLWVKNQKPSQINQALMEIGSTICRSKNPLCLLCPLIKSCQAWNKNLQGSLPLKKVRKPPEFWYWEAEKIKRGLKWAFVKNTQWPFLKGRFVFPGSCKKRKRKPKIYDFVHNIMHYQIFVRIQNKANNKQGSLYWLTKSQIKELNPSSLIEKILNR